jgi:hypothetical protein
MEDFKNAVITRVKNDTRECDSTKREEIISKIANAETEKDVAFILLDYNLPNLFAESFPPCDQSINYIIDWSDEQMQSVVDSVKKQQQQKIAHLSKLAKNFSEMDQSTYENIETEDQAINFLANLFNTDASEITKVSPAQFALGMINLLTCPESYHKIKDAELTFIGKHAREILDKIYFAWTSNEKSDS